ncbi:Hsp20/alpha crystallin family protein [Mesorhizobium sp. M1A.F.Ca.ET.072.01.1.1]|uniref:Hsp20/alpha crystallin family protein n=1 Tax=Mesorhizobium sp. M1A.F.Ca.ET.072.01.1.1 TaxID=2496753 RepID=UPI000FD539AF|nr:Hsp20/alpha crystallin family protein [Mesorhizobium sp. M1A.F.Ca.ET.072.01.1.1]RUW51664.1 Hsp20/alpha crystallin family protein [Mesorhizobium sp. M1A.F.Ca.ET.072.01.1.1]TIV01899.1 MAG: Hsp20 family protein [Mesorhizobium sp.]
MAQELKTTDRQVISKPDGGERTRSRPVFVPRADIYETQDNVVLLVDMPGVASDGVDITLEKRTLAIRGYAVDQQPENYRQVYPEHSAGDYERVFTLSEDIDRDGIEASQNGVLRLVLPKAAPEKARKIQLKMA